MFKKILIFFLFIVIVYVIAVIKAGPYGSLICVTTFQTFGCAHPKIWGTTAPGFEELKEVMAQIFASGFEKNAQMAAFQNGKEIAHLWGSSDPHNDPYFFNSLQIVFSSTKVVESIAIAMMVDRGHLSYEQKVSKYWPEFGQKGKENITLEDVMKHSSGLHSWDGPDLTLEQIRNLDQLADLFAKSEPKWPGSIANSTGHIQTTKKCYHSVTRGIILNEIIRRTDPKKRTIGKFIDDEIVQKLSLDFYLGTLPPSNQIRVKSLTSLMSHPYYFFTLIIPYHLDGLLSPLIPKLPPSAIGVLDRFTNISSGWFQSNRLVEFRMGTQRMNTFEFLNAELSSTSGLTNAFSLARMAASLLNPKSGLVSNKTLTLALSNDDDSFCDCLGFHIPFTKGGFGHNWGAWMKETHLDIYGWSGYGGSLFIFEPKLNLTFAYTPSLLLPGISGGARAPLLAQKLFSLLKKN